LGIARGLGNRAMKPHREIGFDKKAEAAATDVRGPTAERIWKANGAFDIGGDDRGIRTYTFSDCPLGAMFKGKRIDPMEFTALQRYKHHWHHGGLLSSMGSVDLNRVFASDPSNFSGMAKSERQAFHRQQYREARELIGHRPGIVVDNVVCQELSLEIGGYAIGWRNRPQAVAAATEMLRDAGYRLSKHWGIS